jgi:hypothetical protein
LNCTFAGFAADLPAFLADGFDFSAIIRFVLAVFFVAMGHLVLIARVGRAQVLDLGLDPAMLHRRKLATN